MSDESSEQRASSSTVRNPKIHSDSGYGSNKSNKSNSQSRRSSGSSKSQQSSLSSGSGCGYPDAPVFNVDCQSHPPTTSGAVSSSSPGKKREWKRKHSTVDKKPSTSADNQNESTTTATAQDIGNEGRKVAIEIISNGKIVIGSGECASLSGQPMGHLSLPSSTPHSLQMSPSICKKAAPITFSQEKNLQDSIQEPVLDNDFKNGILKTDIEWQDYVPQDFTDGSIEDAFATVLSLNDGIVAYISSSITNILGFPADLMMRQNFANFVHPKDKTTFASHLSCGINKSSMNKEEEQMDDTEPSTTFYCRLLQYHGLKTLGFVVTDKTVIYHPFKLNMQLKKVKASNNYVNPQEEGNKNQDTFYLVVGAIKLKSAYQYSEEIPNNPTKFMTRHSATCNFGHVDAEAISYLGHLPQDLIGNSALSYYHPEDMDSLKDTYDAVIQEQGKPFRSKPYRFRVYNGTFAVLETDWSCFINPWSWKLEFVIGQHRVIQGPVNPNVFMPPSVNDDEVFHLPDELVSEGKEMQNQIKQMLTETVTRRIPDPIKPHHNSQRRKDLAVLMETLLEKIQMDNSDTGSQCSAAFSVMERDSVMLGALSPHTVDNSGSDNQSSSTPPSYNQLNYRENIERFFQSQPKTERSEESGGGESSNNKMDVQNQSSDQSDSKSGSNIRNSNDSNDSGGGLGGEKRENAQFGGSRSLTQALLTRHNEDMEKSMMQRHKDLRVKTPCSHKESRLHRHSDNNNLQPLLHICPMMMTSSQSMDNSSDLLKFSSLVKQRSRRGSPHKICNHHHHHQVTSSSSAHHHHGGVKRCANFPCDMGHDYHHNHLAKQPHLDCMADNILPSCSISSYNCTPAAAAAADATANTSHNRHYYTSQSSNPCIPHPDQQHRPIYSNPLHQNTSTYDNATSMHGGPQCAFIPGGRQNQQFLQQQVQLMPAGVIYQPVSSYGQQQHPQILMPLGTMFGQAIVLNNHHHHPHSIATNPITAAPTATFSTLRPPFLAVSSSSSSLPRVVSSLISGRNFNPPQQLTTKTIGNTTCCNGNVASVPPSVERPSKNAIIANKLEEKALKSNHQQGMMFSSADGTSISGSDESMTMSMLSSSADTKEGSLNSGDMSQVHSISDQSMDSAGSSAMKEEFQKRSGGSWTEKFSLAPELSLTYTIPTRDLSEVLRNDMQALKIIGKQSSLVNDQLTMLYNDLANDGLSDNYALYGDEGISSSSNSGGEEQQQQQNVACIKKMTKKQKIMNVHQYTRVAIIHEENAPFPPENLYKSATTAILEKVAKALINIPTPISALN